MQGPSWGIHSALQNPYEEAPALAPHMLSHPSQDEYTQLAEMTMQSEGVGLGMAVILLIHSFPWHIKSAMTREG